MGKHHYFEEIVNFRDVGGYNTMDGRTLKEGKIFRSSMFFGPNQHDQEKLKQLGIHTMIDLRSPKEVDRQPNAYAELVPNYRNINLSGGKDAGRSAELAKTADGDPYFMSNRYMEYVAAEERVTRVFRTLLTNKDRPTVLHCSAGKDRTGVITYLLLRLHNVLPAEIVADYQVSYTYIKQDPRILRAENNLNIYISYPQIMERFHTAFSEKYGNVENYFYDMGFSRGEIKELGQLLL